jgi:hypothetical protein
MRTTAMVAMGGAVLAIGAAAPAWAAQTGPAPAARTTTKAPKKPKMPKKRQFTAVQAGIRLSTTGNRYEDLYRIKKGPFGEGTVIRDATLTSPTFPASGSDTARTYDRGGRTIADETYTLGTPNTAGIGTISGKGTCDAKGGTGTHLDETCTYAFRGSYDLLTGFTQLTLSGTYTLSAKSSQTK